MTIQYFSELKILVHLSDKHLAEICSILGAESAGSQTCFNFYCTLNHAERDEMCMIIKGFFSNRLIELSNLNDEWVMISVSVFQNELDNPTLESELETVMLQGLVTVVGAETPIVKIKPPPVDSSDS